MKTIFHPAEGRRRPNKHTLSIAFALMLVCGTVMAENDPRDVTQGYNGGNVHVDFGEGLKSFQTQQEADTYMDKRSNDWAMQELAKANAENKAVEIGVRIGGQDVVYKSKAITDYDTPAFHASEAAAIQQHIVESRQGTENFKQQIAATIIQDGGTWTHGLSTEEQDKQREIKIKQAHADADKLQAEHEAQIKENTKKEKAAIEARQKAMRPLTSYENKGE